MVLKELADIVQIRALHHLGAQHQTAVTERVIGFIIETTKAMMLQATLS